MYFDFYQLGYLHKFTELESNLGIMSKKCTVIQHSFEEVLDCMGLYPVGFCVGMLVCWYVGMSGFFGMSGCESRGHKKKGKEK